MQMNSDPRGRYFTKIAVLRKEQDEKELRILQNSKTVEEYEYWTDLARSHYHKTRYEGRVEYLKELGLKVPSKFGELVMPEKQKKTFPTKKKQSRWYNRGQASSDIEASYAYYMGAA